MGLGLEFELDVEQAVLPGGCMGGYSTAWPRKLMSGLSAVFAAYEGYVESAYATRSVSNRSKVCVKDGDEAGVQAKAWLEDVDACVLGG